MRSAASEAEIPARPLDVRPGVRRTRVVVNRIDPWSVLKVSLLFYLCVMLVFMVAMVILFSVLRLTGLVDTWSKVLGEVIAVRKFRIDGGWLFWRVFVIGLAGVVVWSLINFVVAILYNRISDIVGGIKVTMTRKR